MSRFFITGSHDVRSDLICIVMCSVSFHGRRFDIGSLYQIAGHISVISCISIHLSGNTGGSIFKRSDHRRVAILVNLNLSGNHLTGITVVVSLTMAKIIPFSVDLSHAAMVVSEGVCGEIAEDHLTGLRIHGITSGSIGNDVSFVAADHIGLLRVGLIHAVLADVPGAVHQIVCPVPSEAAVEHDVVRADICKDRDIHVHAQFFYKSLK